MTTNFVTPQPAKRYRKTQLARVRAHARVVEEAGVAWRFPVHADSVSTTEVTGLIHFGGHNFAPPGWRNPANLNQLDELVLHWLLVTKGRGAIAHKSALDYWGLLDRAPTLPYFALPSLARGRTSNRRGPARENNYWFPMKEPLKYAVRLNHRGVPVYVEHPLFCVARLVSGLYLHVRAPWGYQVESTWDMMGVIPDAVRKGYFTWKEFHQTLRQMRLSPDVLRQQFVWFRK